MAEFHPTVHAGIAIIMVIFGLLLYIIAVGVHSIVYNKPFVLPLSPWDVSYETSIRLEGFDINLFRTNEEYRKLWKNNFRNHEKQINLI